MTVASQSFSPVTARDLDDVRNTEQGLDDERHDLLQRITLKRLMSYELMAGRVSLAEATDGFLAADEGCPKSLAVLRKMFPGRSDRERAARNVIAWAHCGDEPRPNLVARLEAEFRSLFQAD